MKAALYPPKKLHHQKTNFFEPAINQERFHSPVLPLVIMKQKNHSSNSRPQSHLNPDKKNQSAAGFIIANNEDLSTQILHRLPVRSLLRLQFVSKLWLSIISSPPFHRLIWRRDPQATTSSSSAAPASVSFFRRTENKTWFGLISFHGYSISIFDINSHLFQFLHGGFRGEIISVDSCNGLLATVVLNSNDGHIEFRVCNLTTRRVRPIQRCRPIQELEEKVSQGKAIEILGLNIVFDPLKSDHYKLVCIWWLDKKKEYGFAVYSSENRTWREINSPQELHSKKFCFKKGVFWKDRVHWIGNGDGDGHSKTFVWLDLDKERFNLTTPALCSKGKLMYFGESRGHLYIVELNFVRESLDIFEFIEVRRGNTNGVIGDSTDCSGWSYKNHIDLAAMYLSKANYDECSVLSFVVDERKNKSRFVLSLPGEVILYDINDYMTIKRPFKIKMLQERKLGSYQWNEACQHMTDSRMWLISP